MKIATNESIISHFDDSVSNACQQLLGVPLLHQLHQLSRTALHYFFSQLYHFVEFFPGLLGILLAKTTSKRIRFAITENLVDEFGGIDRLLANDYSGIHSELLRHFISRINDAHVVEKAPATAQLMQGLQTFFQQASLIEAFAAMASMECMSTDWFTLIHRQLTLRHQFEEQDLAFFALHMSLDDEHGDVFKEELMMLLQQQDDLALMRQGISTSISHWLRFYAELAASFVGNAHAS